VAVVAALTGVNVSPSQLQRRQRHQALDWLRGGLLKEQGNDLYHSTDQQDQQDQDDHEEIVGLYFFVRQPAAASFVICHGIFLSQA
jgi:hypothetical protein